MGFFDKLFGGRQEYPELDADNPATRRLTKLQPALESLAQGVNDPLEVVPTPEKAYVFIGKPPKQFGLAWVEGSQVRSLKDLLTEHKVDPMKQGRLVEELRQVYRESESEQRFRAEVAGREMVVTPSERLGQGVEGVLSQVTH
ncbi:MAG: hypothetical protein ACNA8S_17305 [Deferrisomatales bacterium]